MAFDPITVTAERSYEVIFTENWRNSLQACIGERRAIYLVPSGIRDRLADALPAEQLLVTADGEAQKTLDSFAKNLEFLAERDLDRHSLIVGIGGGATTDLAGFLAATYLRGISWIAVPTTLAGMVDAAIGGKTGINLAAGKNLAGSFYSPEAVIVDFGWLDSLSTRDTRAGLAESVKCGFISDPVLLDLIGDRPETHIEEIVARSISVKAEVVSKDFRESFGREILNYGHTLGHAIEKDSDYQLRHGEAISIGLIFAAEISSRFTGLSREYLQRHYEILGSLDLPTSYPRASWPHLLGYMARDKKRVSDAFRFVTLEDLAKPTRTEVESAVLESIYLETVGR